MHSSERAIEDIIVVELAVFSSIKYKRLFSYFRFICLGLVVFNSACTTIKSTGHDRDSRTDQSAFEKAARDSNSWVPALAALLVAVTDTDHSISRYATEHNPIYGSQSSAQNASDQIRGVLAATAIVTSLASPGKEEGLLVGRTGNVVLAGSAALVNSQLTNTLKDSTGRTRPNVVDQRSFPSSHATAASTYATISSYRVQELSFSQGTRDALSFGLHTLAAAAAWARVEAKAHYPTDVLVGYALGNYTTVLLHEFFQEPEVPVTLGFDLDRKNGNYQVMLNIPF